MLPKHLGRDEGSDVVVQPPLSQAVGYVVVVVIGLVIAFSKPLFFGGWSRDAHHIQLWCSSRSSLRGLLARTTRRPRCKPPFLPYKGILLTFSQVHDSKSIRPHRVDCIRSGIVLALVHRYARLFLGWLCERCLRPLLVCRWL